MLAQLDALLSGLAANPLGLLQDGADLLRQLGTMAFDRLGGLVEDMVDFLATLPSRMGQIGEWLADAANRLLNKDDIIASIHELADWVHRKLEGDLLTKIKEFVDFARSVVSFIPDGTARPRT